VITVLVTVNTISSPHWDNAYPSWRIFIADIIDNNCTESVANYRNTRISNPSIGYDAMGCILDAFPEYRKAEIAAASVVLGLAPAMLAQLGPSYADTAVLAYRDPVLAVLLAAGSPAVKLTHVYDRTEFFRQLNSGPKWKLKSKGLVFNNLVPLFEYILAFSVIANNAHLMYQLGVWAVCSIAPSLTTLPRTWYASIMLLHLGGWLMIRNYQTLSEGSEVPQDDTKDFTFAAFTSVIYVICIIHALYGAWVLSSLVFIPITEALFAVLRLMLSTLLCHGVLLIENSMEWRT
jgi:hypothetical protein